MFIEHKPNLYELFGINPRLLRIRTDAPSEANLRIEITLSEAVEGVFVPIATLANFYDASQLASFNLSKLLPFGFDLPPYASITAFVPFETVATAKKYQVDVAEYYGEGAALDSPQNTDVINGYAVRGGRSVLANRAWQFRDHTDAFLTLYRGAKSVFKNQPEFLSYLSTYGGDSLSSTLKVQLQYSDGSTGSFSKAAFEAKSGGIVIVPTGYLQLGLATYEMDEKFIVSWSVELEQALDEGTVTSDPFDYQLRFEERDWEVRYFVFTNPIGGLDVVASRGKTSISNTVQREVRSHVEGFAPAYSKHTNSSKVTAGKRQYTANLGWRTRTEREWLEALLYAERVWEIDLNNQLFVPIHVTSTEFAVHRDDVSLQSLSFSYHYPDSQTV